MNDASSSGTPAPGTPPGFVDVTLRIDARYEKAIRALLQTVVVPDVATEHDSVAMCWASTIGVREHRPCNYLCLAAHAQVFRDPADSENVPEEELAKKMLGALQAYGACAAAAAINAGITIDAGVKDGTEESLKQFLWGVFYEACARTINESGVAVGANLAEAIAKMPCDRCAKMFGGMGGPDAT